MTQTLESVHPDGPESRESSVVPRDDEWTRHISSVMPGAVAERIVVVTSDPSSIADSCRALEQDGYELSYATPECLPEIAEQLEFDLILVDMARAPEDSLELCKRLRIAPATCHETIIFMTDRPSDTDLVAAALLAGADDCIVVGRRMSELLARVRVQFRNKSYRDTLARVRDERDNFRREASLDPLTLLPNRKALYSVLRCNVEMQRVFAVLFLDIDHFKRINDELGHAMGDEVLRTASACLKQQSRSSDVCGRFGGEEFLLVLDVANGPEALRAAERHRRALEKLSFPHSLGTAHITASVGVAVYDPSQPISLDELLSRADAALYEAKRSGRNASFLSDHPQVTILEPQPQLAAAT